MSIVITALTGGLGNQLFQYAAGKALALHFGAELMVDTTNFRMRGVRPLAIDRICPSLRVASEQDIARVPTFAAGIGFEPAFFDQRPPVRLKGYWQTERYFAHCASALLSDITLPAIATHPIAVALRSSNSVAIHVRRGDYTIMWKTYPWMPIRPLAASYYAQAERTLIGKTGDDVEYFCFSDDISWCRQTLALSKPIRFVEANKHDPAADLCLIAQSRHHIIANSTFSWWAAWFADQSASHNDRVVIGPKNWFRDGRDSSQILPERWTALPNSLELSPVHFSKA